ncbi:hypothetical protein FLA105534_02940 [Flavobacterium bizetiae]|uniref:Uncharacterized protein n=2 Tax=Flavobacterium bizetiae TaxID=2704140 RepID=A0A6J4GLS8_9FLAO|nr:hypothetical protein FLA105534_02940 [Flavobacterium bizetiae]CAD5343479.1 hypothetical protein FLA105535_03477 [Flavobacterium bizetiae]CAD5349472.1 hypothetical protein FLA105534_03456 [Flavobacterium bizetiae]
MQIKFILSILFIFFSLSIFNMNKSKSSRDTIQNEEKYSNESIQLKTERVEKKRKSLFWKLPHKKIIITDRVITTDRKLIVKTRSIHICSLDACDTRKFRRIKIIKNEIWIFRYNADPEKAIIKRYDSYGKFLSTENWDQKKSFEDY